MKTAERKIYEKRWRVENAKRFAESKRLWKLNNREIVNESEKKYYSKNKNRILKYRQHWREINRERDRENNRLLQEGYKRQVVNAYGRCCSCCGEDELTFLTIEHSKMDGMEHRKVKGNFYLSLARRGFPQDEGLTVNCMNCNWAKRNGRECPHKRKVLELIA